MILITLSFFLCGYIFISLAVVHFFPIFTTTYVMSLKWLCVFVCRAIWRSSLLHRTNLGMGFVFDIVYTNLMFYSRGCTRVHGRVHFRINFFFKLHQDFFFVSMVSGPPCTHLNWLLGKPTTPTSNMYKVNPTIKDRKEGKKSSLVFLSQLGFEPEASRFSIHLIDH